MALALTMPRHENYIVEKYRKDPDYARLRVQDEFQEYTEQTIFVICCLPCANLRKLKAGRRFPEKPDYLGQSDFISF